MAYDYHGSWNHKTGQLAPLYAYSGNEQNNFANYGIKYWIKRGAPSTKLFMGSPTYGLTYTLANPQNHDLNAPTTGAGQAGEFTKSPGSLAYYELCGKIKNQGWTVKRDPRIGSYAFKGNQWMSCKNKNSKSLKKPYCLIN